MRLCEVCQEAEAMPSADPYEDLDLCPLCKEALDEAREERFMNEWLGIEPPGSEVVN